MATGPTSSWEADDGVWRSVNSSGQNGSMLAMSLPPRPVYSLVVDTDNLIAGTYGVGSVDPAVG